MSIFAIGDLHLSFAVDKPMNIYGADWENHAERVRNEWVSLVSAKDTVIIPGDISWALKFNDAIPDLEWIHELPGQKILIKGNHDLWWHGIRKLNTLYNNMFFLQNNHYEVNGVAICGSRGWESPEDPNFTQDDEKIYRRELLRMEMSLKSAADAGIHTILAAIHYPPAFPGNRSEFTDLFEKYKVNKVVYGHLHGTEGYKRGIKENLNGIEYHLVSLDYLSCRPLKIWEGENEQ